MARTRVAGIGAGYFSRFHLEGWRRIEGVELAGWCDTDPVKTEALATLYGVKATFMDAARMLDELRPDVVDIVTPPATHHALVALAAERGISTICQKPLAPTYEEAAAIVATAEAGDIPFIMHENFRWQPWYREAKRLIDDGALGYDRGPEANVRRQCLRGAAAACRIASEVRYAAREHRSRLSGEPRCPGGRVPIA